MGSPRKIRSKYSGPWHPWQRSRIESEKEIQKNYGLKSKKEIWKAASEVRRFNTQAKKLIRNRNARQSKIEAKQLLDRLANIGLLPPQSVLEDILALTASDLLDRRLQTLVYKKGFAFTQKQARQFILHGHIQLGGKKVSVPSYIVSVKEEDNITLNPVSSVASPEHPERVKERKKKKQDENKAGEPKVDESVEELKKIEEIEKVVGAVQE